MKLNIKMKDGTELKAVYVFYTKELNDTKMKTRDEFLKAIENNHVIFFCGKYTQGGVSPKAIESYEFLEHDYTIDELQALEKKSEDIAYKIIGEIKGCECTRGSSVQKLQAMAEVVRKYS
jgi:hypothetical protein